MTPALSLTQIACGFIGIVITFHLSACDNSAARNKITGGAASSFDFDDIDMDGNGCVEGADELLLFRLAVGKILEVTTGLNDIERALRAGRIAYTADINGDGRICECDLLSILMTESAVPDDHKHMFRVAADGSIFDAVDSNHDGYLGDAMERENLVQKLIKCLSREDAIVTVDAMSKVFDADGKISKNEYLQFLESPLLRSNAFKPALNQTEQENHLLSNHIDDPLRIYPAIRPQQDLYQHPISNIAAQIPKADQILNSPLDLQPKQGNENVLPQNKIPSGKPLQSMAGSLLDGVRIPPLTNPPKPPFTPGLDEEEQLRMFRSNHFIQHSLNEFPPVSSLYYQENRPKPLVNVKSSAQLSPSEQLLRELQNIQSQSPELEASRSGPVDSKSPMRIRSSPIDPEQLLKGFRTFQANHVSAESPSVSGNSSHAVVGA